MKGKKHRLYLEGEGGKVGIMWGQHSSKHSGVKKKIAYVNWVTLITTYKEVLPFYKID